MRLTAVKIIKIILGSAIFAMGIQWFYHPAKLLSGGITGVALILNSLLLLSASVIVALAAQRALGYAAFHALLLVPPLVTILALRRYPQG